ncbi:hypothetical protein [Terricaulis sp.]|uniref:hypothetical protein n=1 Tax=Terricaulis sp. TaxID=2768686 RepID=UPI0037848C4C
MGVGRKIAVAWLALLAAALAPAATAQVPDPYARDLAQRLAHVESVMSDEDYMRAAGPFFGPLSTGGGRRFTMNLRAGQEYRIVGVCDGRCSDLDLRAVFAGQVVAEDLAPDVTPVLHIQPRVTGPYEVQALMVRCRGDPCWFAFNVYSR